MACAIEAVPRYTEADADDDDEWADDDEYLPDGAHWDEDCPLPALSLAGISIGQALLDLHHQAHGPGPVLACRAQPCRLFDLDQLKVIQ